MNVLCYTALNPHRRFVEAENSILALDLVKTWWMDDSDDPNRPWYDNILAKYKAARSETLEKGYAALLLAESDMLIPSDALMRLGRLRAPVAYGLYCWRHGVPFWNAYVALEEGAGISLSDELARHNAPLEWGAARAKVPFQCYGVGFGCTLIRREVLEKLDFRNFEDAESFYVDWLFAADCNRLGFRQMCDPAVVCGHIGDSGVFYPDITTPELFRHEVFTGR